MSELGDLQLERPPDRKPRQSRRTAWLLVVVLLAVASAALFFLFRRSQPTPTPSQPPASIQEPARTDSEPPETAEATDQKKGGMVLPPLDESDGVVRQLVRGLSSHPQLAAWLLTDDLIGRFAVVVDNIAEGVSPRTHLLFLAPEEEFRAREREGRDYLDPQSYHRFDLIAGVFSSIDAEGTAELYGNIRPLIDQAYRDLGYPYTDFDQTLAKAIDNLLRTPVVEEEIELVPLVLTWELADPELEALSPAQKGFLRMGPRNMRLVKAKLLQFARALNLKEIGGGTG